MSLSVFCFFFFFNDTATTEIYTLSLHDALPISLVTIDRFGGLLLEVEVAGFCQQIRIAGSCRNHSRDFFLGLFTLAVLRHQRSHLDAKRQVVGSLQEQSTIELNCCLQLTCSPVQPREPDGSFARRLVPISNRVLLDRLCGLAAALEQATATFVSGGIVRFQLDRVRVIRKRLCRLSQPLLGYSEQRVRERHFFVLFDGKTQMLERKLRRSQFEKSARVIDAHAR